MTSNKQKRLAREYADQHGVKYTEALRAITDHTDQSSPSDLLHVALGRDLWSGEPYELPLDGTSPHVLITGPVGSGAQMAGVTIALQVGMKRMPWDLSLTGSIVVIDPHGTQAELWSGRGPRVTVSSVHDGSQTDADEMATCLEEEAHRRAGLLTQHGVRRWVDLPADVLREERLAPIVVLLPDFPAHMDHGWQSDVPSIVARLVEETRLLGIHIILVGNFQHGDLPPKLRAARYARIVTGHASLQSLRSTFGPRAPFDSPDWWEGAERRLGRPGQAHVHVPVDAEVRQVQIEAWADFFSVPKVPLD